jgi:hypothetical protein
VPLSQGRGRAPCTSFAAAAVEDDPRLFDEQCPHALIQPNQVAGLFGQAEYDVLLQLSYADLCKPYSGSDVCVNNTEGATVTTLYSSSSGDFTSGVAADSGEVPPTVAVPTGEPTAEPLSQTPVDAARYANSSAHITAPLCHIPQPTSDYGQAALYPDLMSPDYGRRAPPAAVSAEPGEHTAPPGSTLSTTLHVSASHASLDVSSQGRTRAPRHLMKTDYGSPGTSHSQQHSPYPPHVHSLADELPLVSPQVSYLHSRGSVRVSHAPFSTSEEQPVNAATDGPLGKSSTANSLLSSAHGSDSALGHSYSPAELLELLEQEETFEMEAAAAAAAAEAAAAAAAAARAASARAARTNSLPPPGSEHVTAAQLLALLEEEQEQAEKVAVEKRCNQRSGRRQTRIPGGYVPAPEVTSVFAHGAPSGGGRERLGQIKVLPYAHITARLLGPLQAPGVEARFGHSDRHRASSSTSASEGVGAIGEG